MPSSLTKRNRRAIRVDFGRDVRRPEAHLGVVGAVAAPAAVDQQCRTVAAVEQQVVLDRLGGQREADLVLVEVLTGRQIGRDEYRRDSAVCDHWGFLR